MAGTEFSIWELLFFTGLEIMFLAHMAAKKSLKTEGEQGEWFAGPQGR